MAFISPLPPSGGDTSRSDPRLKLFNSRMARELNLAQRAPPEAKFCGLFCVHGDCPDGRRGACSRKHFLPSWFDRDTFLRENP